MESKIPEITFSIEYLSASPTQREAGRRLFKRLIDRSNNTGNLSLEKEVGSVRKTPRADGMNKEHEAKLSAKKQNELENDSLKKDERTRQAGGGRSRCL